MTATPTNPEACHNCRRRRLKCDRSLPKCLKCAKRRQDCLGYGNLLRWDQGIASRGKMAGITSDDMRKDRAIDGTSVSPLRYNDGPLEQHLLYLSTEIAVPQYRVEPLMHGLDALSRKYLHYFASDVCRDLVLYDIPKHNPFRELIPLAHRHPILLQTIVANSALHMTNAHHRSSKSWEPLSPTQSWTSLSGSPASDISVNSHLQSYRDALVAKQKALRLLKLALASMELADVDVTLAVVLLFVEFELLDSGRNNWRFHINGARTIIEKLCGITLITDDTMSPLRKWLVSNCLVFDLLGSSLASSNYLPLGEHLSSTTLSLLQDAEGNHCSSFPAVLLPVIQSGAQLLHMDTQNPPSDALNFSREQEALRLLQIAQAFDPVLWATELQQRSPAADLLHRIKVASAHRGAVCIYLSRVIQSLWPIANLSLNPEVLAAEIISHLSFVRPSDALFTATAWPAFIAGADTDDLPIRAWVVTRFQELWDVEPWGLTKEALGVLNLVWEAKGNEVTESDNHNFVNGQKQEGQWIKKLKVMGIDWLIA